APPIVPTPRAPSVPDIAPPHTTYHPSPGIHTPTSGAARGGPAMRGNPGFDSHSGTFGTNQGNRIGNPTARVEGHHDNHGGYGTQAAQGTAGGLTTSSPSVGLTGAPR